MDLYGSKSKSIPQKATILILEIISLSVSYWILFLEGGKVVLNLFGTDTIEGDYQRRYLVFTFSVIVFLRFCVTLFYLLKRKIPWEEAVSVPLAFALYYVGFSLFVYGANSPLNWIDYASIGLFLFGSFLNTFSELQRHNWKKNFENKGKLYTQGLFRYSMHINFFGDLLWVCAYAIVSRHVYSIGIPVVLFCFFVFYNVPKLDSYLAGKYGEGFANYSKKTAKLIPFLY